MASTDAGSDLAQLIEQLPRSAGDLAARATALGTQGRGSEAERALRVALARHPSSVLRVALARVLNFQDRPKEAMAEMVSVLRHEPENADALLVLATCLLECGEVERGVKMLDKARISGANVNDIADIEDQHARLLARSTNPNFADRTQDEPAPGAPVHTRPAVEAPSEARQRHQTLMGRPNPEADLAGLRQAAAAGKRPGPPPTPGKARRVPPPPLQSGTFAGLDTYDVDGDGDDDGLDATGISETVQFGRTITPAPDRRRASPPDFAAPDEHTFAGRLGDTATPDEATAHIHIDEVELAERSGQNPRPASAISSSWDRLPSVQYDASFAEEARIAGTPHAPPADLDDLPSWGSDGPHVEPDPTAPDQPRMLDERFISERVLQKDVRAAGILPSLDASVLFDDVSVSQSKDPEPLNIPMKREYSSEPRNQAGSGSHPGPRGPGSGQQHHQPHVQQPQQQQYHHQQPQPRKPDSVPSFQLEGNSVPVDQRWVGDQPEPPRREQTAVAAEPRRPNASGSMRLLFERRWPLVLVLVLAVVLAGFLGLCIAAGTSLNSELEAAIVASNDARAPDTYDGFLQAESRLLEAANAQSFMGGGFDSFIEKRVPIPGLGATRLRRSVVADLAAVSSMLEHRFEAEGVHKAAERTEIAKERAGSDAMSSVAAAYLEMTANRPHIALQILDEARESAGGDPRLEETRAWALLALDRADEAARVVQPMRDQPGASVHQKYLIASIDAARGVETASSSFADVFTESPDHIDSRIGRSYTLRKEPADIVKAQQVLDTVLVQLARKASRFQKARATSAYGSTYLAAGEKERAEDRFRDAIRTMPGRSVLYEPLLQFYAAEGRTEEIESYLTKAREEGAYSPALALFEARQRLMNSEPEKATSVLAALELEDAGKAFLQGLALLEARSDEAAVALLEKAQDLPGDSVEVQALYDYARGRAKPEALEDAIYQLDRLKAKNADNAVVHWALGAAELLSADATTSKSKRAQRLEAARLDLERATELDPSHAPAHFALCEVLVRELETDAARKRCDKGRELAPRYVPGVVATARLRLAQGRFEDARKLAETAAQARPNDGVVGLLSARIAIEQRRVNDAREELNRWIAEPPDLFEMNLLEGRLEFTRNQYTKAAGFLKKAYEMRPADGEAAMYYAHTLTRLGEDKSAAKILLDNLSHPTWSGYAWAVLGEARRRQNKLKDARINFAKARKLYDENKVAPKYWSHLYAQWALAEQKRYRKWRHRNVVDKLTDGRKKGDADDPEINLMWSRYHLEKRKPDHDAAIRSLKRVVEAAPYHCEAFEALRNLYVNEDRQDDLQKLEEKRDPNCSAPEAKPNPRKK